MIDIMINLMVLGIDRWNDTVDHLSAALSGGFETRTCPIPISTLPPVTLSHIFSRGLLGLHELDIFMNNSQLNCDGIVV